MRDRNPFAPAKRRGTIAPVSGRQPIRRLWLACGRRIPRQDRTGFLRLRPQQPLRHRMQGGFEFLAIGFAQRRLRAAIDDLVQFVQIHVEPPSLLHNWLSNSRKRGVKGKPRTSLMERFGLLVWSFLPRPVVSPSSFQLAAR